MATPSFLLVRPSGQTVAVDRYRCIKNVSKRVTHARFRPNPIVTARRHTLRSAVLSGHERRPLAYPDFRRSGQAVGSSSAQSQRLRRRTKDTGMRPKPLRAVGNSSRRAFGPLRWNGSGLQLGA